MVYLRNDTLAVVIYLSLRVPSNVRYVNKIAPYVLGLRRFYEKTGRMATMQELVGNESVAPSERIEFEVSGTNTATVLLYNVSKRKILYRTVVEF